jgi:hypothetical protein
MPQKVRYYLGHFFSDSKVVIISLYQSLFDNHIIISFSNQLIATLTHCQIIKYQQIKLYLLTFKK